MSFGLLQPNPFYGGRVGSGGEEDDEGDSSQFSGEEEKAKIVITTR